MKIQNGQYPSINQLQDEYFGKGRGTAGKIHTGISFQEILDETNENVFTNIDGAVIM